MVARPMDGDTEAEEVLALVVAMCGRVYGMTEVHVYRCTPGEAVRLVECADAWELRMRGTLPDMVEDIAEAGRILLRVGAR